MCEWRETQLEHKQVPWKIVIHCSVFRGFAGFTRLHRGVILVALLNYWLGSQVYQIGQHWTTALWLDAFFWHSTVSICNLICFPSAYVFYIALQFIVGNLYSTFHRLWQRVTENEWAIFLLGQYQYISIQFGFTTFIIELSSARSTLHTVW